MSHTATDTLNDLLETLKDGQEGFRKATENASSATAKELFADCSLQRYTFASELQALARSLGEPNPTNTPSLAGKLHRGWIDAKGLVTSQDDHAILAECERGEDAAVAAYKKALETELPPVVRTVLETQFAGIQTCHNRVRDLRDHTAKK